MTGYRVILADRFDGHHIIDFPCVSPDYAHARDEMLAIHHDLAPILRLPKYPGYLRVEAVKP